MSKVLPGFLLALSLAIAGKYLSELIGITWMGLPKSPISAIMIAILLGILIRNTIALPEKFQPGIRFGLVRILRLGIVLLGIRLTRHHPRAPGARHPGVDRLPDARRSRVRAAGFGPRADVAARRWRRHGQ